MSIMELDFELIKIEVKEMKDDELPEEIKEWVQEKPKLNLKQTITLNIRTTAKPKEL